MATDRQFRQLYFLLFAPFALQVTFLNLYFDRRGLSHGEIGSLTSLASALGIAAPILIGRLADRLGQKRPVLILATVGAGVLFPLHWFGHSFAALALLTIGLALCRSPQIPLVDAMCLDELHYRGDRRGGGYAPLRIWGSLGFMLVALGFPLLLPAEATSDPLQRLWPVFAGFAVLSGLMAWRTWRLPVPPAEPGDESAAAGSVKAVLAIPGMKRLLALLLVSFIGNAVYYVFLSLYLDDIGVADRWKGSFWSVGVLAEVAVMAAGPWLLRRCGVRGLILLGFLGRALRSLAYSFRLPPLVALLLVQPLHALAFGAVHLGTIAFLAQTAPASQRATAQTLAAGLAAGLGGVIGNLLAGWISEATTAGWLPWPGLRPGLYASFLVGAALQLVVLCLAFFTLREPTEAVEPGG